MSGLVLAGPEAAERRADHVRADDEIFVGVDGLAGADKIMCPAICIATGMRMIGVAMTHQDRIRAVFVERAPGFIGKSQLGQQRTGSEFKAGVGECRRRGQKHFRLIPSLRAGS